MRGTGVLPVSWDSCNSLPFFPFLHLSSSLFLPVTVFLFPSSRLGCTKRHIDNLEQGVFTPRLGFPVHKEAKISLARPPFRSFRRLTLLFHHFSVYSFCDIRDIKFSVEQRLPHVESHLFLTETQVRGAASLLCLFSALHVLCPSLFSMYSLPFKEAFVQVC